MLEDLKERVCAANLALARERLAVLTWGNASEIDRARGLVVIKPSGVPYDGMKPSDMVVVGLDGKVVEGRYRPSSDTPTHLVLYKAFPQIGGVVHTHSPHATAWAQAGRAIPNIGTTHADTFHDDVPVTGEIPSDRIRDAYEEATGDVIVETFRNRGLDPPRTVYLGARRRRRRGARGDPRGGGEDRRPFGGAQPRPPHEPRSHREALLPQTRPEGLLRTTALLGRGAPE